MRKFNAACSLTGPPTSQSGIPGVSLDASMLFFRDYMRAAGFRRSLAGPPASLDAGMQNLALDESQSPPMAGLSWSLPAVDFTAVENLAFLVALLRLPLDQDQGRLRKYLERVPLAIAAITGVSKPPSFDAFHSPL